MYVPIGFLFDRVISLESVESPTVAIVGSQSACSTVFCSSAVVHAGALWVVMSGKVIAKYSIFYHLFQRFHFLSLTIEWEEDQTKLLLLK